MVQKRFNFSTLRGSKSPTKAGAFQRRGGGREGKRRAQILVFGDGKGKGAMEHVARAQRIHGVDREGRGLLQVLLFVEPDRTPRTTRAGEALKKIAKLTPSFLAGTRGAQGTIWLDEQQKLQQTPAFPVHTVDTLGAGDVFHGAFSLAITEKQDLRSALTFASAAAALKCTRFGGAFAAPQRAEVEALLSQGRPAGPMPEGQ